MKRRNLLVLSSVISSVLVLSGCNKHSNNLGITDPYYDYSNKTTDSEAYNAALPEYEALLAAADSNIDSTTRYALYAKAEAYLLDQAVLMPTTTQGSVKTISRIVPRTAPYTKYGSDNDKFKGMRVVDKLITAADREKILAQWEKDAARSRNNEEVEGDDALLADLGYTYKTDYNGGSLVQPNTLDYLSTSYAQDAEVATNLVDGLVEHDRYGNIIPALAESWTISEDGLVYSFKIRNDAKWVKADGTFYANLTAQDFVVGFQHMLDAAGGTEKIVREMVVGVDDYLKGTVGIDGVGVKAENDVFSITLKQPSEYFLSVLTFNAFLPLNQQFFESYGGALGLTEYKIAHASLKYDYGRVSDINSILYCGAYRLSNLSLEQTIVYVKNESYWDKDKVYLNRVTQSASIANSPTMFLEQVIAGQYVGCGLSTATLPIAEADPAVSACIYTSDNQSITFYAAFNMNRRKYGVARGNSGAMVSPKTQEQREDTRKALLNKHFRKAVLHAFDKFQYNLPTTDEDTADLTLRNTYIAPDFVTLPKSYGSYAAGTSYTTIVQDELKKLGSPIIAEDGQDGWFNKEYAKQQIELAYNELKESVSWPVQIDVLYISAADASTAMLSAVKKSIQETLGRSRVVINMVNCDSENDYLTSSFLITEGDQANYDLYYGSGWAPDYADPKSYLDTLLPDGRGYCTKTLGLW